MSGSAEGKIKIGKADVYIHVRGKSGASVTHLDIELDALNDIIGPGENSFVGGKKGGIFIGLKKEMIQRVEDSLSRKLPELKKEFPVERAEKKINKK